MCWFLLATPLQAWAVDDVPELPPPPIPDARVDDLQAELEALRDRLAQLEREALLAQAEALARAGPAAAPPPTSTAAAFNPRLTAFGDVLTTVGVHDGQVMDGSGPWLRSLELDLRADVDPFAKAVAVLAVEQESPLEAHEDEEAHEGEEADPDGHGTPFLVAPEEVYIDLVALPAGLSGRAGQFRQPFGVSNKSHPHDLPWADIPLPITELLGEEGYADVGGLLAWRLPNRWTGLTVQGAVLRGELLDPTDETAVPQWLGRAEWFHDAGQVDWGLGATATGLGADAVGGVDLLLRWRINSWRSALLLAEVLADGARRGGYVAVQVQPTRPLFLGVRADAMDDGHTRVGGYASWYTSEFLRVRAGATREQALVLAHLQLTFVWGSHPVEPYWVNR